MFFHRKCLCLENLLLFNGLSRALKYTHPCSVGILSVLSALGHFQKVALLSAFSCPPHLIDEFSMFSFWLNNWLRMSKDADEGGKGAPCLLAPGLVLVEYFM